jgi:hypothetical protein
MASSSNGKRRLGAGLEAWNRRVHYFLGLYFLLFIWLFSLTGLLLNHPRWRVSRIPNDPNPVYEQAIQSPLGATDLARAQDVIRQLGLRGEIDWPASRQPDRLDFNVVYPRQATQVAVDLRTMRATVRTTNRPLWPALTILHTFSGSRYNALTTRREWLLTSVWTFAMDALAIGLVIMVCGSYYMWYRVKPKRTLGALALGAGFFACALFVVGLAWGDSILYAVSAVMS